jgi:hypothetical protein
MQLDRIDWLVVIAFHRSRTARATPPRLQAHRP